MPSGYDQRALIGYVYNDSGSNFVAMWAHDRAVKLGQAYNVVSGGSATVQTLTDVSAVLPPVPLMLTTTELMSNTTGSAVRLSPVMNSTGNIFGIYWDAPVASYYLDVGQQVPLEFQYFYYMTSSGSVSIYIRSYQW